MHWMSWACMATCVALAGCTSASGDMYASFDDALAADGESHVFGDVTVKLLAPTGHAHTGVHDVYVFIYDNQAMRPITDAGIALEARMPAMDHGTDDEADPSHRSHGVYVGHTDLFMPGQWTLTFQLSGIAGDATFTAQLAVEDAGSDHHH